MIDFPNSILYKRWNNRKEGVISSLTPISSRNLTDNDSNLKNIIALAKLLEKFTNDRIDFFLNGFFNQEENPNLIWDPEWTPESILQEMLIQIQYDVKVIKSVFYERQEPNTEGRINAIETLANEAFRISAEKNLIDPILPIAFFQQDTTIRLVPYAPTFLLGLPYTAMSHDFDLLSIPHEVAHHVYNFGAQDDKSIKNLVETRFINEKPWVKAWLEEIFADVYGVMVAGPIVALSAQVISEDNSPKKMHINDGEHPPRSIRPFIYTTILKSIHRPKTAAILKKRWEIFKEKNGVRSALEVEKSGWVFDEKSPNQLSFEDGCKELEKISEEMFKFMTETLGMKENPPKSRWGKEKLSDNPLKFKNLNELETSHRKPDPDGKWDDWIEAVEALYDPFYPSSENKNFYNSITVTNKEIFRKKAVSIPEKLKESTKNLEKVFKGSIKPRIWHYFTHTEDWKRRGGEGSGGTRPVFGPEPIDPNEN